MRWNLMRSVLIPLPAALTLAALLTLTAPPVQAVNPGQWRHDSEADFQNAELDQVVVTNLGELKLARAARVLADLEAEASIVYDLAATDDGTTWLAVGPEGRLMKMAADGDAPDEAAEANGDDEGTVRTVRVFPGHQIFALHAAGDMLWIALSGPDSRIVAYRDGEPLGQYPLPGVRYVWDVLHDAEAEALWIATGLPGNVWRLSLNEAERLAMDASGEPAGAEVDDGNGAGNADAGGNDDRQGDGGVTDAASGGDAPSNNAAGDEAEQSATSGSNDNAAEEPGDGLPAGLTAVLETQQDNVLTLAHDPDRPALYAGTDGEGLVYRLTPSEHAAEGDNADNAAGFDDYVVYDAAEPEIGALLVASDGTVYIGTADAEQARPGRLEAAVDEPVGAPAETPPAAPTGNGDGDGDPGDPGDPDPPLDPEPEPKADSASDASAANDAGAPDADTNVDARGNTDATPDTERGLQPPIDANNDNTGNPAADGSEQQPDASDKDQAESESNPDPTPEQYDALRAAIRQRLAAAREDGRIDMQVDPGNGATAGDRADGNGRRLDPRRANAGARSNNNNQSRQGNAVYALDADGFVREVFRESVMILRLVEHEGNLLVATGNEGQLYRLDPDAEETTVLARLESQQIPALLPRGDHVLIGAANVGQLLRLDRGFAASGLFTSDPLDAEQISLWGKLRVLAETPSNTGVRIRTRSGNVGDPDLGSWSAWSDWRTIKPETAGAPVFLGVNSPPARFLQYRLELTSEGQHTPVLDRLTLQYLMPNLKPRIQSVKTEYESSRGDEAQPRIKLNITWETADPNDDELIHTVEVRPLGQRDAHITLADDLTETNHTWDTRTMADGRYEVRITTSDRLDNVPGQTKQARRVSGPVVVDNTPPSWHDVTVRGGDAAGSVHVGGRATDELSVITGIRYRINGQAPWQAVLPQDMIFDSTDESVSFTISDLPPGRCVIALRVTDALGNAAHVTRTMTVPESN